MCAAYSKIAATDFPKTITSLFRMLLNSSRLAFTSSRMAACFCFWTDFLSRFCGTVITDLPAFAFGFDAAGTELDIHSALSGFPNISESISAELYGQGFQDRKSVV